MSSFNFTDRVRKVLAIARETGGAIVVRHFGSIPDAVSFLDGL